MQHLYPDFFHYFFVYQHFQRFTQTGFNNAHPVWFYVPLIIGLTCPWWPVWVSVVSVWAPVQKPLRASGGPGVRLLSMVVWLVVIVGFFSMPNSQVGGLCAAPALAAPWLYLLADGACSARKGRWWVQAVPCYPAIGRPRYWRSGSFRQQSTTLRPMAQGISLDGRRCLCCTWKSSPTTCRSTSACASRCPP